MHVVHSRGIYWKYFTFKSVLKLLRVTKLPVSLVLWIRWKYYCFQVTDSPKMISTWSAQSQPPFPCAPSPMTPTWVGKHRQKWGTGTQPLPVCCTSSTAALTGTEHLPSNPPKNYNSRIQKTQIKVMRYKSRLLKYIGIWVCLLVSIRGFCYCHILFFSEKSNEMAVYGLIMGLNTGSWRN